MAHDPVETLRAYVKAFETLDPEVVFPFYHTPCMFIAPFGVSIASETDAARHTASALIEHARSQGYQRTEITQLRQRNLASSLVSLSGVFVRFGVENLVIGRFGFTYIMRHDGARWRIVVAVAHDALQVDA